MKKLEISINAYVNEYLWALWRVFAMIKTILYNAQSGEFPPLETMCHTKDLRVMSIHSFTTHWEPSQERNKQNIKKYKL